MADAATRRRWFWPVVAVLIGLRVLSLVLALGSGQEAPGSILGGDARRYHEIAFAEGTPYEDFAVEYPPGALVAIVAVDDLDPVAMLWKLGWSQLALELVTAAVLWWAWGRAALLAYLVLGTPFLLYPFPYFRVDLVAVALATGGMALLRKRHDLPAGVVTAAAVLAKAWPIVLGGAFLVERRGRALGAWMAASVALVAGWVLWAGTAGPIEVFSFRGATGWQIESLPGIVVHALAPERAKVESGAWRTGVMPGWSRPTLTVLSFGGAALAWVLADRRRRAGAGDHITFGLAPLVAITSLLVFAPIISPQYLLWLVPWAAILVAAGDRLLGALTLAAVAASTLGMLFILDQIEGGMLGVGPVLVRNGLLVAIFAIGMAQLAGWARTGAQVPASNVIAPMSDSAPTRSSVEVNSGTP